MGKTKSFVDPETVGQQPPRYQQQYSSTQTRSRKTYYSPERISPVQEEMVSTQELAKQILFRLKRTWISLKYRLNKKTFGILENKAILKFGILLLAGFFLFKSDGNVLTLFSDPQAYIFGEEKGSGKKKAASSHFEIGGTPKPVSWAGNDAAPISVGGLSESQANEYIERYAKIAQVEMNKFGIPASISLAQGLVESRGGLSTLARRNNNHFGMKCFSKRCAKGHCSNFTDDHHKDFFRIYKNSWESWRAHSEMLASGRYTALKKYGRDYQKWAYGLKSLGYATDKTYAEKLIGMIERYELYKYDR